MVYTIHSKVMKYYIMLTYNSVYKKTNYVLKLSVPMYYLVRYMKLIDGTLKGCLKIYSSRAVKYLEPSLDRNANHCNHTGLKCLLILIIINNNNIFNNLL